MIGFIIGIFVGASAGFLLCGILTAGKRADENQPSQ